MIKRRLWGSITQYNCASPRMFWVKLKVAGEKIVIVGVYSPGMERCENERDEFWECFNSLAHQPFEKLGEVPCETSVKKCITGDVSHIIFGR